MKRHTLLLLILLNAALAAALAWLWFDPKGGLRNSHWQPPPAQKIDFAAMVPVLPPIGPTDTSQFVAMLDRPLFSVTRRPPPPPPPVEVQDNLSSAKLYGIYVGEGGGGVILQIAGKNRRLRLHESIEGWTLQSIQGRVASFSRNGAQRQLQLQRAKLDAYTGAPLPQPPTPPVPSPAPAQPAADAALTSAAAAASPPQPAARDNPAPDAKPASARRRPVFGGTVVR